MLSCQKDKFFLEDEVTYLNAAYLTPLLKSVREVGIEGLDHKKYPYRIKPIHFFEEMNELRQAFAKLINCSDAERTAIVPSVSYGMANIAQNIDIKAGQEIIITGEQFPSNVYNWQRLAKEKGAVIKTIEAPNTKTRAADWNQKILDAITPNTKVVSSGMVHWADGTLFHLEDIRQKTREVGAYMIIDGTQSVGALPFDVEKLQPDALVCAGYKWLMGPYTMALAYFGAAFDKGTPIEDSWMNRMGSENFENLVNYQPMYQPKATRYNMGQGSNFMNVPMMKEALRQIQEWGVQHINDYCQSLVKEPIQQLRDLGFSIETEDYFSPHLFGVRLPENRDLEALKAQLLTHNIYVSVRGNAVRISPNVYNTKTDFDKLLQCLTA